jgi:hypothetical protein
LCANCYDRTNGIWDDRRLNLSINTLTIRRPSLSLVVTRLPLGSGFFADWGRSGGWGKTQHPPTSFHRLGKRKIMEEKEKWVRFRIRASMSRTYIWKWR